MLITVSFLSSITSCSTVLSCSTSFLFSSTNTCSMMGSEISISPSWRGVLERKHCQQGEFIPQTSSNFYLIINMKDNVVIALAGLDLWSDFLHESFSNIVLHSRLGVDLKFPDGRRGGRGRRRRRWGRRVTPPRSSGRCWLQFWLWQTDRLTVESLLVGGRRRLRLGLGHTGRVHQLREAVSGVAGVCHVRRRSVLS